MSLNPRAAILALIDKLTTIQAEIETIGEKGEAKETFSEDAIQALDNAADHVSHAAASLDEALWQ